MTVLPRSGPGTPPRHRAPARPPAGRGWPDAETGAIRAYRNRGCYRSEWWGGWGLRHRRPM